MALSKRHRYKSGREKLKRGIHVSKTVTIFVLVGMAIFLFKERVAIWDWLETYFY